MKIQVLPCVIAFIDGVSVDRIIGFEGLGRSPDNFTTRDLEARLINAEVFVRPKVSKQDEMAQARKSRNMKADDDDDDDDWD
jgi:hypothetical protein